MVTTVEKDHKPQTSTALFHSARPSSQETGFVLPLMSLYTTASILPFPSQSRVASDNLPQIGLAKWAAPVYAPVDHQSQSQSHLGSTTRTTTSLTNSPTFTLTRTRKQECVPDPDTPRRGTGRGDEEEGKGEAGRCQHKIGIVPILGLLNGISSSWFLISFDFLDFILLSFLHINQKSAVEDTETTSPINII